MIQLKKIGKRDRLYTAFGFTEDEITKIRMDMVREYEEAGTWAEAIENVIKDIDDDTKIAYVMFEFGRLAMFADIVKEEKK